MITNRHTVLHKLVTVISSFKKVNSFFTFSLALPVVNDVNPLNRPEQVGEAAQEPQQVCVGWGCKGVYDCFVLYV